MFSFSFVDQSYFHFRELERVVVASPEVPFDPVSERRVSAVQVRPVQVRMVAATVPPSSLVGDGTVLPW